MGDRRSQVETDRLEIEGAAFRDPFEIPASYSGQIPPSLYPRIFGIIERRHRRLLKGAFRDPAVRAVLLCDGQVVATAESAETFDPGRIREIEREHNRLCFIFGKEDAVEESEWAYLGPSDAYPTVRVWVAPEGTEAERLRERGVEVLADFDTGNPRHPPGFYAFDDTIREQAGLPPGTPGQGAHLGQTYFYTRCVATVGSADESGGTRVHRAVARFIVQWDDSPFVRPNPARRGFVGREIMFALRLRITLDPSTRRTYISFL